MPFDFAFFSSKGKKDIIKGRRGHCKKRLYLLYKKKKSKIGVIDFIVSYKGV
jgi:hypothetical protein